MKLKDLGYKSEKILWLWCGDGNGFKGEKVIEGQK